MKINTKVFEVSTPNKPGNWMGKVLTAYLNIGFWMAIGHYIKESSKDVVNSEIGPVKMALRTAVRVGAFPITIVEGPIRILDAGVKIANQKLDELCGTAKTEEIVDVVEDEETKE